VHRSFFEVMQTGLNRQNSVLCPDVNENVQKDFKAFVLRQLEGCSLEHEFYDLKFSFNTVSSADAIIPSNLVVLLSGGIDSMVGALYALKQYEYSSITLLFVDYGSPYNACERICAASVAAYVKRLYPSRNVNLQTRSLDVVLDEKKFGKGYLIPARNALLSSLAILYGDKVWLSTNWRLERPTDDINAGACDKAPYFFATMSEMLSRQYKTPISVTSPIFHMTKAQTIQWLIDAFPTAYVDLLHITTSCYSPSLVDGKVRSCGACYGCWKAAAAFRDCNIWDLVYDCFLENPFQGKNNQQYQDRETDKGR